MPGKPWFPGFGDGSALKGAENVVDKEPHDDQYPYDQSRLSETSNGEYASVKKQDGYLDRGNGDTVKLRRYI